MGLNNAATFLQPLRYELYLIKCNYDKDRYSVIFRPVRGRVG